MGLIYIGHIWRMMTFQSNTAGIKNRLKDLQREFQNGGWTACPLVFCVGVRYGGFFFLRMTRVMPDVWQEPFHRKQNAFLMEIVVFEAQEK